MKSHKKEKVSFSDIIASFRAKILFTTGCALLLFIGVIFVLVRFFADIILISSIFGIIAITMTFIILYVIVARTSAKFLTEYHNFIKLQTAVISRLKSEHQESIDILLVRDKQLSEINSRLMKSNVDLESSTKLLIKKDRELVAANEQLINIDELKSEFVTTVAHQLRTPLSGTKWILSMLAKGELGPVTEEERSYLIKAYDSNNRMIVLVNELLDIERVENNKIQYTFSEIDLFGITDSLISELSPSVKLRGVEISVQGREAPFKAVGDLQRITTVIQNLLDNATKYISGKGTVLIKIEKEGTQAKFTIKDSGIGIPASVHDKMFTLFYRAPNATETEADGTGAGLYLSKKILDKHKGKIWFESEEGKGSTFYFTLPLDTKVDTTTM